MIKSLYNGRAGLTANQSKLDAISNNISNISTTGYKKIDVAFEDIYNEKINKRGLPVTNTDPDALSRGSGSKADTIVRTFTEGTPIETNRQTDIAISGAGYFKLKDDNGNIFYTRDGNFNVENYTDQQGIVHPRLVHNTGLLLTDELNFPDGFDGSLSISADGTIASKGEYLGTLSIYDFTSRDSLVSQGNSLFSSINGDLKLNTSQFALKQGYLEGSNVELTDELTDMMITQRVYQMNSKTLDTANDMWKMANNLTGR
jgi:flagellar basal-body rod protein FlgG